MKGVTKGNVSDMLDLYVYINVRRVRDQGEGKFHNRGSPVRVTPKRRQGHGSLGRTVDYPRTFAEKFLVYEFLICIVI